MQLNYVLINVDIKLKFKKKIEKLKFWLLSAKQNSKFSLRYDNQLTQINYMQNTLSNFWRVTLIKVFKAEFYYNFVNEILSIVCYITMVCTIIGLGNNRIGQFHGPPLKGTEWYIE